jgi:hypothetical protein
VHDNNALIVQARGELDQAMSQLDAAHGVLLAAAPS